LNKSFPVPAKKRVFIGLLAASILGAGGILTGIWYLAVTPGRGIFKQVILFLLVGLLVGGLVVALFGISGIVLTILYAKDIVVLHRPMRAAVNIFFPLTLALGRVIGLDSDKIKSSFIEVNNFLVKSKWLVVKPEHILLLIPHCLQKSGCRYKITPDIDNCRRCGGCIISEILVLRDKYGIKTGVATGGTLARKFVQEFRPRAIVAVACERDLTSGIMDTNPIPVLGVTNERPYGPCLNTRVDLKKIEEALNFFLTGGQKVKKGARHLF